MKSWAEQRKWTYISLRPSARGLNWSSTKPKPNACGHIHNMQFITLSALAALVALGQAQLKQVTDFKSTPTGVKMYSYIPKTLTKPAPIIVAVHHCQGSASGYSSESQLMPQADKYGIILIFPNSKSGGGCFDVASQQSKSDFVSFFEITIQGVVGAYKWEKMLTNPSQP